MEETSVVLTVKELVLRAQPLTATSSLKIKLNSPNQKPQSEPPPSTNPNHKILTPLKHSINLLGTLTLPTETLKCPIRNCFRFSDDSSTICCDILDFRVNIIGKRIRVLACNFIPLKHFCGGGFLEIIKWSFVDSTSSVISSSSSSLDLFPLVSGSPSKEEDQSKARYRVNGPIESISPVFIVPCSIGDSKSQNLRGFVARIMVCQCEICNSIDSIKFSHSLGQGNDSHSFTKPSFVYFCGASWCCHPVITKLIGTVIMLSGLKKKLVFIGKESQLMFVTTEYSGLQLSRVLKKWPLFSRNVIRGNGECGVYTGIVRGVYMQGMVVELDKEVWLLLTDQQVTAPHSLREGAIISAWNVHFVNPKFSWTKMLVLGACFKTSITVESFSPLETGCHKVAQSQNQLGKFIESLTFSARLWCYQKEGLVQMFARSHLPASIFRARLGVLSEFCRHESCGCGSEPYHGNLKLVAPISILLSHCENMWTRTVSKDCHASQEKPPFNFPSHERMSYCLPSRSSFSSEDTGILLLGSLKISPSSGRLHLVDATGSIDVLIPDLPSTWRTTNIYEVVDYSLIMEGMPKVVDRLGLLNNESLSCSHIFHYVPRSTEMNLAMYSYFHLSCVTCKNLCFYPSVPFNEDLQELQSGRFHLIWISHKYPLLQQLQGNPVIPNRANVFVEAVVLPWDLSIAGMDPAAHSGEISRIWLNQALRHYIGKNHEEYLPNKRCKMDCMPSQAFVSVLVDDHSNVGSELSACSGSLRESTKWKCGEPSCPEIQCLAITRNANSHNLVSSGKLCCTNCKVKIGADYKPSGRKVLLEFSSDSLFIYQLLQIGGYYVIKHHKEESFCSHKDYNNIGGGKICVSSRICPWSLSFSFDDVTNDKSLHDAPPGDSSISNEEVLMKNQVELLLRRSTGNSPECSDVQLHLSADTMHLFAPKLNKMKEGFMPVVMPEEAFNGSPHFMTKMSASSTPFPSSGSSCVFPEGNLITVLGNVVTYHFLNSNLANADSSCETISDIPHMGCFQGIPNSYCIHVLVDKQMVRIFGSLSKHAYAVGFGAGVNATFHRVLKWRLALDIASKVDGMGKVSLQCAKLQKSSICIYCGMEPYRVPEISIFTIYNQGVMLKAVFIREFLAVYLVISFRSCMSNNDNASHQLVFIILTVSILSIVVSWFFRGTNRLMLTPASFIVINSIRVANEASQENSSDLWLYRSSLASLDRVSFVMISELNQCTESKPMKFYCRVVAVHFLVLENRKYDLASKVHSRQHFLDIPLASFVLDDGSSSCYCWANAERAATLLRLHEELPMRAFESSGCTLKWVGINKSSWKTTIYHLERMLKKHHRIVVKNHGSLVDSSYQDLNVSVSSDDDLSSSDDNLLKFIIFHACIGTFWTVTASVMELNAVNQLEKEHLVQMDKALHPMQNVWAREVCYTDTRTEAWNMVQEQLRR
ncbi:hypothetical protein SADUNF_Sadunf02G0109700 [Salix dunnii]|uniref:CST complex subunit CTC1 n=1 Tax=Salix dunnii TaxID=1413687 RepID=A0A835N7I7_9ROSI|nr:hypothetical protein SADUNF_Sadunf02G0109700 [Salix dunnii]